MRMGEIAGLGFEYLVGMGGTGVGGMDSVLGRGDIEFVEGA